MEAEEYFRLGWEEANNNNFEKALEYYNKAINIDKEYCAAYVFRSIAYNAKQNYKAAIEDCNTALKLIRKIENTPEKIISILVSRADIYIKQDLYDEAINDCREALKLLNNSEDLESVAFVKAQLANAFALRHHKFSKINDLVIAYCLDNSSIGIEADKILQEKLKNVPIELFENMPVEELIETVNSCCDTLAIEGQVAKSIHTKPTKGRKLDL